MLLIVASILNFYSRARFSVRGISLSCYCACTRFKRWHKSNGARTKKRVKVSFREWFEIDPFSGLIRPIANKFEGYISACILSRIAKCCETFDLKFLFCFANNRVFWNFLSVIVFFFCGFNNTSSERREAFYFLSENQMDINDQKHFYYLAKRKTINHLLFYWRIVMEMCDFFFSSREALYKNVIKSRYLQR